MTKHNKKEGDNMECIDWPSWIQAISTIVIIFVTGYYAYYAREQVKQMEAAVKEARAMREESSTTSSKIVDEMGEQSKAMQELAAMNKKTVELTDRSIKATQEQFGLEQRAWIDLEMIGFTEPLNSNKLMRIAFAIKNIGKTPAQHVNYMYFYWIRGVEGPATSVSNALELSIAPGGRILATPFLPSVIPQQQVDLIEAGEYTFGVGIRVTYFDIYNPTKSRLTSVCVNYNPTDKVFAFCDAGGSVE